MPDDREGSSGAGVVIAAVAVVLVLLVCGGGALALAGLFVYRISASPAAMPAPPPPVSVVPQTAHVDVVSIEADGSLLWNDSPVTTAELRQRLDELKNAVGPPRSVILKSDAAAPAASRDEVVQLLTDRGIGYIVEGAK
jgi:biopolymer transport protein ExbD